MRIGGAGEECAGCDDGIEMTLGNANAPATRQRFCSVQPELDLCPKSNGLPINVLLDAGLRERKKTPVRKLHHGTHLHFLPNCSIEANIVVRRCMHETIGKIGKQDQSRARGVEFQELYPGKEANVRPTLAQRSTFTGVSPTRKSVDYDCQF